MSDPAIRRQAWLLGKPVYLPKLGANRPEFTVKPRKIGELCQIDTKKRPFYGRVIQPTPSALSLRCSAERSMPTNSAVREMLPEKRLICAIR